MYVSSVGIELIKKWESCSLVAYKNPNDPWTIGWGHTGQVDGVDIYEGMTITQEKADELLYDDLSGFCVSVTSIAVSKFPGINQYQYDALVSYTYNRGAGASDGSNGLRQLIYNSATLEEVGNNFTVYWGTNTTYYDGLIARRKDEAKLFNTPVPIDTSVIDLAVAWVIDIANDDSHGYDQANRWGVDYDCSSLVISAYEYAGLPVKKNGASYTGDMILAFKKCEFVDITGNVNLVTGEGLKKGDIVWRSGHVAMMVSDTEICQAHSNEKGTVTGGKTGDQTGKEIDVRLWQAPIKPWTVCLRYKGINHSGGGSSIPSTRPTFERKRLSKLLLYSS